MESPIRAIRWRGPQPVRGQAESDFSSEDKKAWEINGLYTSSKLVLQLFSRSSEALKPVSGARKRPGLAQASQSPAGIWSIEETASREISEDAIDDVSRSREQSSRTVTTSNIVHGDGKFKYSTSSRFGAKPLEDHLVRMASRKGALFRRSYRPGEQRTAEDVPREPGRRGRKIIDRVGHEMRESTEGMPQM